MDNARLGPGMAGTHGQLFSFGAQVSAKAASGKIASWARQDRKKQSLSPSRHGGGAAVCLA